MILKTKRTKTITAVPLFSEPKQQWLILKGKRRTMRDSGHHVSSKTQDTQKRESEEWVGLGRASEGESQRGSCHGRLAGQAGRTAGAVLSAGCRKPSSRKEGGHCSKAGHTAGAIAFYLFIFKVFFLLFEKNKNKIKSRGVCSVWFTCLPGHTAGTILPTTFWKFLLHFGRSGPWKSITELRHDAKEARISKACPLQSFILGCVWMQCIF